MPTLTSTRILKKTLSAYRVLFPFINKFNSDFTSEELVLGQTAIAHIRSLPTAANYDPTTGYANGATSARTLLTDLPLTVDSHKHVPVYLDHIDAISDEKESLPGALEDQAYVLGKTMVDSILAKATSSNLSYGITAATADSDLDVIEQITSDMNTNQAAPRGRIGLVNSAVAQALALDNRIASKDYYGQLTGPGGLRMFTGVGGFEAIYEYPGLMANNRAAGTFTADAGADVLTKVAHGYSTGDRVQVSNAGGGLPAGLVAATSYYAIRLNADTFKLASSATNASNGTAIDITTAGTGLQSVVGAENVSGVFFNAEAIALYTGLPKQSHEAAAKMGIPQTVKFETLADPINGFALAHLCWMQTGTVDLYSTVTALWGSAVGRQGGAAGALTDRSAIILRSL
jgi:hypothetical protein